MALVKKCVTMVRELSQSAPIHPETEVHRVARRGDRAQGDDLNAWLEPLIGAGESEGPTDVSSRKHDYLAEPNRKESQK
jgi:hypothetical protein